MDKKLNPTDHVVIPGERDAELDSAHEEDDGWGNTLETTRKDKENSRNLEHGMKKKWYEMIPYEKILPYMPKLRIIRGSKKKLNITVHAEISEEAQSLFEKNKSFFRHRAQVDVMAYYLGIRMMVEIYLTRNGFPRNKLSLLLETEEPEQELYDQMSIVKEKIKKDVERFTEGMMTEDEIHSKMDSYLLTFENEKTRETMCKIFDRMIDKNEVDKAKDRVRKRVDYKRSQFRVVE
jgi:predicted transcriptional regulator